MLLAYVPDLVDSGQKIDTINELYQVMVNAWLERETAWVNKDELRRFTERLAVHICANREKLGGELVEFAMLPGLAEEWGGKAQAMADENPIPA
jgi:hypothetical protein